MTECDHCGSQMAGELFGNYYCSVACASEELEGEFRGLVESWREQQEHHNERARKIESSKSAGMSTAFRQCSDGLEELL